MQYVIRSNKNLACRYIALDSASGGYPYETSIRHSHIFDTEESVLGYYNTFKKDNLDWVICKLEYIVTEMDIVKEVKQIEFVKMTIKEKQ